MRFHNPPLKNGYFICYNLGFVCVYQRHGALALADSSIITIFSGGMSLRGGESYQGSPEIGRPV